MADKIWLNYKFTFATVHSGWIKGMSPMEAMQAVDLMNYAFWLHDKATEGINTCKDSYRVQKMRAKFRTVYYAGFGRGVSDMHEAILHAGTHGGNSWYDENTKDYTRISGKLYLYPATTFRITSAEACVNFLEAAEACYREISGLFKKHIQHEAQVNNAIRNKDWEEVGKALGRIKLVAEAAEEYMWTAPKYTPYVGRTSLPTTTGYSNIKSYIDLVGKIHSGATTFIAVRASRGSALTGAALGVLREVVAALPILGGLYAAAIDWGITFIPIWEKFIREYSQRPTDAMHQI